LNSVIEQNSLKFRAMNLGSNLPGVFGLWFYKKVKPQFSAVAANEFDLALAKLGPDDICLDLGANIGEFTQKLAATGAKVHSFEPDPNTFEMLEESTGNLSNVVLHPKAIGATTGSVQLLRAKNYDRNPKSKSLGSSVVRKSRFSMDPENSVDVEQVNFFDFVASLPKSPALIKMDIEGAEWPILEALCQKNSPKPFGALFVETHERFNSWRLMPKLNRLRRFTAANPDPMINLYWH